ncbi:hypothetical protein C8R44DRAFT_982082 [Mycena epipterygia]|nr:hypothetical protein C8R44DRAFT_982082 [Mycena epipterygia]
MLYFLQYGIPLLAFVDAVTGVRGLVTNSLVHDKTLANASTHTVVRPNVDTLYSEGILDLSAGDVVAAMPTLEAGRFYVWPFYDLYGNNICNIGTTTNSIAGNYLIKYRPSDPGCALDGDSEYAGIIYMPTAYGITLLRIEVRDANDVTYVTTSIQPGFKLTAIPSDSPASAPPLTEALLSENMTTNDTALYIMQLTARLAEQNPPEVAADVARMNAILEAAGISISAHTYTTPAGVDLTLAYSAAQAEVSGVAAQPAYFQALGGEWTTLLPALCGNFLGHYDVRAYVANQLYLQLQATEALYPTFSLSETFYANQSYVMQFFGKPQVNGFWSLTMYDADGFLVPNSLDIYALGDRSNMTYPDGTLVYGGASPANSAEVFYVLLQSTDIAVSPEWASNWLPTPAAGAEFHFTLRWYGPEDSLLDGTYAYPALTAVAANPPLPSSV